MNIDLLQGYAILVGLFVIVFCALLWWVFTDTENTEWRWGKPRMRYRAPKPEPMPKRGARTIKLILDTERKIERYD